MKWALLATIVIATVLGDLLQSREMKLSGAQQVDATRAGAYRAHDLQPAISASGHLLHGRVVFRFMALLQNAPLSFAVPASAATFVLETILAKFVLKEMVGPRRAFGALLVLSGVVLLAR